MFKWDEETDESEPSEFVHRAGEVIFAAKKLRHPVLFRECFIHLVARLHDDGFYSIWLPGLRQDTDLWPLLNAGKSNLRQKILRAQHAILLASLVGRLELGSQASLTLGSPEDPEDCAGFYKCLFDRREQMMRSYYDDLHKSSHLLQNFCKAIWSWIGPALVLVKDPARIFFYVQDLKMRICHGMLLNLIGRSRVCFAFDRGLNKV
jgi:hypothetical protein